MSIENIYLRIVISTLCLPNQIQFIRELHILTILVIFLMVLFPFFFLKLEYFMWICYFISLFRMTFLLVFALDQLQQILFGLGKVNINNVPYDLMQTLHLLCNSKENSNFFPKIYSYLQLENLHINPISSLRL